MIAKINQMISGRITRCGFGGPWMRGKNHGQLPLFMIWTEDWQDGEVMYGYVLFSTSDYQPQRILHRMKGSKNA